MKTENLILGLISVAVVGGIGYSIYKKTQTRAVANNTGGAKPEDASLGANGMRSSMMAPTAGPSLKTASTRSSIFQPAGSNPSPSGKVRWVEGGIIYEGSKDRKTKKAVGEA